jgi:predicted DNA-binding antitoxin AbrB/MazE fold protein
MPDIVKPHNLANIIGMRISSRRASRRRLPFQVIMARKENGKAPSRVEVRTMMRTVPAVYENGAFRPLEPVSCQEHERVLLTVEDAASAAENLFDGEFLTYCDTQADDTVSLEAVRQALAKIPGSLTDEVRAERDER